MNYNYDESKGLIIALVPRYTEFGNVVYIYYEDGSFEISDNRLKYVFNCYLLRWGCSLETKTGLRKKSKSSGALPIVVTYNHTFIPLRVRDAKFDNDYVYGYFCHEKISYPEDISRKMANALICKGIEFEVQSTFENIKNKRIQAKNAQLEWQKLNGYQNKEMLIKNEVYDSVVKYNKANNQVIEFTLDIGCID